MEIISAILNFVLYILGLFVQAIVALFNFIVHLVNIVI